MNQITLPSGAVVRHWSSKRFTIIAEAAGFVKMTYRDEYPRARSAFRAFHRLYGPDARLYLWDAERGDVTPTVVFAS